MSRALLAILAVLAVLMGPASAADAPARLAPGQAVDVETRLEETHRFEVELQAGQYAHLLVQQQGVDLKATVTAPPGAVVLETDCACSVLGPESVAFVAAADGVHVLALKAVELMAPPRGRFQVRLEALRAPTPSDLRRVAALRAAADALAAKGDARAVLEHSRAALEHWVAAGDRTMAMWAGTAVGYALAFGLDVPAQAEEPYRHALATAVELRDEWAQARISDDFAQVLLRLGRMEETRTLMERALSLHRAAGQEQFVARMFTVLGSFFSLTGEPQAALDRLYQALAIYQAAGNARDEGSTRLEIGAAYLRLNDYELALQHYELALPAFASDPPRRGRCTTEMGVARMRLGDRAGARRAYEEALSIYRTMENAIAEGDTLIGLADLHRQAGELGPALTAATAALERYRSRSYPAGIGFAQCRVGDIQRRLGDPVRARAAFEEAVALGAKGFANALVCAERGLALLDAAAGALESAQRHAEEALRRLEPARGVASPRTRSAALSSWLSVFEALVEVRMRRHHVEPGAGHDAAAFDMSERARARTLLDLLTEARVDLSGDAPADLLAAERSLRERLNTAAAEQSRARRAGRAADAEGYDRELDRLSVELADTEARIRTASPRYAALVQGRPLTLDEVRGRLLDDDTQLLQYALGEEHSYLFVVSARRLDALRLAPRAEIEAAAVRLHRLLAAGPGPDGPAAAAAARELSALVVAPAAAVLSARRLVLVAPGALQYVPFAVLPLPEGTPMLDRFELVSAPSASVLAALRASSTPRANDPKGTAVFADPVFEDSDPRLGRARRPVGAPPPGSGSRAAQPDDALASALRGMSGQLARLPFSRREAQAIVALAGPRMTLQAVGFDASRAAATHPRLADYRIIHFATHAVLNTRRPELSGVVLSLFDANGRRQDGFLRLHDIYRLKLNADLVVLSGCQTALGREQRGEGLVGLTRGFLYAGGRAVLASLWQVDDESTAELMKRFYRGMLKESRGPADSLRAAQLEMSRSKRWSAPFHWAGFVLQGESR